MNQSLVVPLIVGMRYIAADELARSVGLQLLNPNPDGPPVGAIAWDDNLTITHQEPEPGTVLRNDPGALVGIKVWFGAEPARVAT